MIFEVRASDTFMAVMRKRFDQGDGQVAESARGRGFAVFAHPRFTVECDGGFGLCGTARHPLRDLRSLALSLAKIRHNGTYGYEDIKPRNRPSGGSPAEKVRQRT